MAGQRSPYVVAEQPDTRPEHDVEPALVTDIDQPSHLVERGRQVRVEVADDVGAVADRLEQTGANRRSLPLVDWQQQRPDPARGPLRHLPNHDRGAV